MPVGPIVRRLCGPYERRVSELWRSAFIDLDAWVAQIAAWAPEPARILEVGCGEGAMTERLRDRFPRASITAIDLTPRLGRLFEGDRGRVDFINAPVEDIARLYPASYDLVILSDVLHHVPQAARVSLVGSIRTALKPGGKLAFKDWARNATPIHWLCHAADRYLTGDDVRYLNEQELRAFVTKEFGAGAIQAECRIAPWANNLGLLAQRDPVH